MTSLDIILNKEPWVPYNDSFLHSRRILTYPKNQIFVTQLLHRVMSLPVYKTYPSAQVFDMESLDNVRFQEEIIYLDRDSHVIMAPEPVLELIQLDRRLHYKEAQKAIFGPFRWLPPIFEGFRYQWLWIWLVIIGYVATTFLLNAIHRKPRWIVVPSKI